MTASRALPPKKSLVELFGGRESSPIADPYSTYSTLRREAPVMPFEGSGYEGILLTRHEHVLEALIDDELYSNRANALGIGLVVGHTIVDMDGAEHHRFRSLVTPSLAPRSLRGDFMETTRTIAHELIDGFQDRGKIDLVEAFTFTYPLRVFTTILGLPIDDHAQVHRWASDLTRVAIQPMKAFEAAEKLADYFAPLLAEKRRNPGNDLISQLIESSEDGEGLTEDEIVSFLRLLIIAGAETSYHLIGTALYAMLTHAGRLDEVAADRSRIQAVMDETLRWEGPVGLVWRETTRDTTVAGYALPAGARIVLALNSANRDEAVFAKPDFWDLDRDTSAHIAFGQGKHFCAGSRFAYAEVRVAIEALLDRLPGLRLSADHEGGVVGVVGVAFRGLKSLVVEWDR